MKNIKKSIFIPVSTIALSFVAVTIFSSLRNEVKVAEANYPNNLSATYSLVTSVDALNDGDKVVFASREGGYLVAGCGANPAYIYGEDNNISFDEQSHTVTCTDADYLEFTVYKQNSNTFGFNSTVSFNHSLRDIHNVNLSYFALNENPTYSNTVGLFKTRVGFRKENSLSDKSKWVLSFDEEHIARATNVGVDSCHLGFSWGRLTEDNDGLYIYKSTQGANKVVKITDPDTKTYNVGQTINLSGLVVEVTKNGITSTVSYNDYPTRFSNPGKATGGTGQAIIVTYNDGQFSGSFVVQLTVDDSGISYPKLTSALNDYRAKYIITPPTGEHENNALTGTGEYKFADIANNVASISDNNYKWKAYIELIKVDGLYRMRYTDQSKDPEVYKFINVNENGSISYNQASTGGVGLEVVFSGNAAYLKIANSNKILKYDDGSFLFTEGGGNIAYLFKRGLHDDELAEIEEFAPLIGGATSDCDPTGVSDNINSSKWASLATSFDALSAAAQGYLASVTYTHNAEQPNSIEDFIDRYDYIVSKYPSHNDFMQRGSLINSLQNTQSPIINTPVESFDSSVVIVICLLLAALGSFALVHFKNKNN